MGEIFDGVAATRPASWTGEPGDPAAPPIGAEDLHRYMFARSLCRGLDVLDMASAEGFGSLMLSQAARSVVGIDGSDAAVFRAAATYRADNLEFRTGDGIGIPLPDASVDLVAAFRTIERVFEQDAVLREVRRVLRPGGRLVVSSPDSAVRPPGTNDADPTHVRELTREEFVALLHGSFAHVVVAGQRAVQGSAIVADHGGSAGVTTFERRGSSRFEVSNGLPRCPTLLAVASDAPLAAIPDSLFIEDNTAAEATAAAVAMGAELAKVKAVLHDATVYARHLETEIENRQRDLAGLRAVNAALEARLPD